MSDSRIRIENGVKVADIIVGDKQYTIKAKRVDELQEILDKLDEDKSLQTLGTEESASKTLAKLVKMCQIMYPEIDPKDISRSYEPQLVDLFNLWQEINFTVPVLEETNT